MKYELDNIYCANAYEAIKDIPDKSIDLIYTDIPYEIEGNGGGGHFGAKGREYHKEYEHFSSGIDFSILDEFVRVCKAIYCYIWCSKAQIYPLMQYFIGKHNCRFEILTWHKTNPIPTCAGKYLSDTEYCLLFREEGKTKIGGTFETKGKYFISAINKADKDRFEHSTIKPLQFVQNHILNSVTGGGTVLDPFCGSGTTCVAAKNLGLHYIGFEIDEKWCKIAKDRLNNISKNGQISLFTM